MSHGAQFTICFVPTWTSSATQLLRLPAAHWLRATGTLLKAQHLRAWQHVSYRIILHAPEHNKYFTLEHDMSIKAMIRRYQCSVTLKCWCSSLRCFSELDDSWNWWLMIIHKISPYTPSQQTVTGPDCRMINLPVCQQHWPSEYVQASSVIQTFRSSHDIEQS